MRLLLRLLCSVLTVNEKNNWHKFIQRNLSLNIQLIKPLFATKNTAKQRKIYRKENQKTKFVVRANKAVNKSKNNTICNSGKKKAPQKKEGKQSALKMEAKLTWQKIKNDAIEPQTKYTNPPMTSRVNRNRQELENMFDLYISRRRFNPAFWKKKNPQRKSQCKSCSVSQIPPQALRPRRS